SNVGTARTRATINTRLSLATATTAEMSTMVRRIDSINAADRRCSTNGNRTNIAVIASNSSTVERRRCHTPAFSFISQVCFNDAAALRFDAEQAGQKAAPVHQLALRGRPERPAIPRPGRGHGTHALRLDFAP